MDKRGFEITLQALENYEKETNAVNEENKNKYEKSQQLLTSIQQAIFDIKENLASGVLFNGVKQSGKAESGSTAALPTKIDFTLPKKEYSVDNQSSVSLTKASQQVLERASKPLHISELVKELAVLGRYPNSRSLNASIRKDSKKRFINLGGNTWDLSSRHASGGAQNTEESRSEVAASTTTPLFSSNEGGNS